MGIQYVDRAVGVALQPRDINAIRVLQATSTRCVSLRIWVLLDATIAEGETIIYFPVINQDFLLCNPHRLLSCNL
jgi:hypothetical protein